MTLRFESAERSNIQNIPSKKTGEARSKERKVECDGARRWSQE